MVENTLPKNVGAFIDRHIYSLSQLELLLWLRRFATQEWTAKALADELHTNVDGAAFILSTLASDGLILQTSTQPCPSFRYEGSSIEADLEAVANAYKERKMRVVERIYRHPQSVKGVLMLSD